MRQLHEIGLSSLRLQRQSGRAADPHVRPAASTALERCRKTVSTLLSLVGSLFLSGCMVVRPPCVPSDDLDFYRTVATNAMSQDCDLPTAREPLSTAPPLVVDEKAPPPAWDMSLDEAIRLGLENSKVLRDLGGSVLRTPALAQTIHDPAIQATDPRLGMDGALSAFDAQLSTRMFAQKNNRVFNNLFLGGGTFLFDQELDNLDTELTKTSASGTQFTVRQHIDYDDNNAPANMFRSSWNVNYETEFRQPLLQGAGTEFNRIAGPRSTPGQINGVVIARINNDVSTSEFEIALRDYVSNLENAYWDLYFAYRDLDAKIAARDTALNTWRIIHANVLEGRGYSKLQEVQALEQYYRFQEDVLDALGGRLVERTRTNNGSSGGTFRGVGGVQAAERRLRLWLGLPINDGKLIRPTDQPVSAKFVFDWCEIAKEALKRRPELRRQQSQVERANMELIANKNFLLPKLDLTGRYRWRGFGHDLIGPSAAGAPFDNAFANLADGQFQEWELGFQYSMTVGFRREYAAVRNSQLKVSRERAILEEQERQTIHDLAGAYADAQRGYDLMQVAYNRFSAAQDQFQRAYDAFFELGGKVSFELVLDARIRLTDAEIGYHRARIEYAVALKNVHFEKGSLLQHNGTMLAGGGTTRDERRVIARNESLIPEDRQLNYVMKGRAGVDEGSPDETPAMTEMPVMTQLPAAAPGVVPASHTELPAAKSMPSAGPGAEPVVNVEPVTNAERPPVRAELPLKQAPPAALLVPPSPEPRTLPPPGPSAPASVPLEPAKRTAAPLPEPPVPGAS